MSVFMRMEINSLFEKGLINSTILAVAIHPLCNKIAFRTHFYIPTLRTDLKLSLDWNFVIEKERARVQLTLSRFPFCCLNSVVSKLDVLVP